MKNNHYPIQFQAQYEQTAEKILAITKKYQAKIINSINTQPSSQEILNTYLEMIQDQINDKELVFKKQSIYSQFASGQIMAENRKNPPQMCPECGDQIKKTIQCQFCAELYCVKCCSRKRVIPFVSKDFRLCCQQCHWKFVKLFDNKHFYEQKQALTNAINHLKTKTSKINEKLQLKRKQIQKGKGQRRSQKIKQKNLQGKVLAEEKKLKSLQQEYRKVIGQKAQKIKQEQRRKRLQQQQREKAKKAEQQRFILQQQQRKDEERRRIQRQRKKDEQNSQKKEQYKPKINDKSIIHKKVQFKQQQSYIDSLRKKQEQLKRKQQQLLLRQSLIKRKLQEEYEQKESNKSNLSSKIVTPKQSIDRVSDDKGKFHLQTNDTISQKRSRKQSQDINNKNQKQSNKSSDLDNLQKILRVQSTQSAKEKHKKSIEPIKTQQQIKEKEQEEVYLDPLQKSLANMLKPKKDDQYKPNKRDNDSKSMYSNKSKSILDMNVNDLLSIRIPTVPNSLKANPSNQQQRPDRFSTQILNNKEEQSYSPKRLSRKVTIQQPKIQQTSEQIKIDRQAIIRNSSLITSHKQTVAPEPQITPNKCSCEIM